MIEKNGPTPHSPLFPISDRVSTSSSGEHLHTNIQIHPHIYHKPSRPTMLQFLVNPVAVALAQAEPKKSLSAYLREYRALGDDFHSAMTFTDFCHFKSKNKPRAYNRPFTQNYELQRNVGKLTIPTFEGTQGGPAQNWVQKLDTCFQLNPMIETNAFKLDTLHLDGESH